MYCVYLIERNDGLKYIGKTIFEKLKYRIQYHKKTKRFKDYELKYEVLFTSNNHTEILDKETFYIKEFDTFKNGLNKTPDGKAKNINSYKFTTLGFKMSEETKEKIRQKSIENKNYLYAAKKWKDPEYKKKMSIMFSYTRKGKYYKIPTKEQTNNVRRLLQFYNSKPSVKRTGRQRNGKDLTYERSFSTEYHEMFNMTDANVYNIIKGRSLVWKELYEKILNTKS